MTRHPRRLSPAADLNSASARGRRFTELLADEADRVEVVVVVVDVEGSATEEPRRRLEDRRVDPVEMINTLGVDISFWRTLTFLATAIA